MTATWCDRIWTSSRRSCWRMRRPARVAR